MVCHKIPERHMNSGFGRESLGIPWPMTSLVLLLPMGRVWKKVHGWGECCKAQSGALEGNTDNYDREASTG